jgi:hypothetical protein
MWDASGKHIHFAFLLRSGPVTCVCVSQNSNVNDTRALTVQTTLDGLGGPYNNGIENCVELCGALFQM